VKTWALIFRDRTIQGALFICFVGFGGFFLWAGFVPLAHGVVAYGRITVENNVKVIQHLEGGLIETIHVDEGQYVSHGDPLLTLTSVAAQSGREQYAQQLANALIGIDRLTALLNETPDWTASERVYDVELGTVRHQELIHRQQELFHQQREAFQADLDVLLKRRAQSLNSVRAISEQIEAIEIEQSLVQKELDYRQTLLDEQLMQASQVSALEREKAALNVQISGLEAEKQTARLAAAEISSQIQQTRARFRQQTNRDLEDLRVQADQARQALDTAQDVVNRTVIFAPQSGQVLNLRFSTEGGVVMGGEPILELVPESSTMIALLELRPGDRDAVQEGQRVRAHLSGLNSWRSASLTGVVSVVSADLKAAPDGRYYFYEARILFDSEQFDHGAIRVLPGMPVEGFIIAAHRRTLLEYLLEPVLGTFRRSLQG